MIFDESREVKVRGLKEEEWELDLYVNKELK